MEMSYDKNSSENQKKMMYHDVVEISFFDTSGMDGTLQTPFIIPLEADTVRLLQEHIDPQNLIEDINTMLQSRLYQKSKTIILTYKKKEKIRMDVLKNFKAVADLMRVEPDYPNLKWQQIRKHLTYVLRGSDKRVIEEHTKSILNCIYNASGKKPSFYDGADCSAFVIAVDKKLMDVMK